MSEATCPPSGDPAIRVVMMPRDTNAAGTIFVTSMGPVEYSKKGRAPFVLALHGTSHVGVRSANLGLEATEEGAQVTKLHREGIVAILRKLGVQLPRRRHVV